MSLCFLLSLSGSLEAVQAIVISLNDPAISGRALGDNGKGSLTANVSYEPENDTITNTYDANGVGKLEVIKAISGSKWPDGNHQFSCQTKPRLETPIFGGFA